ncbi:hypothetical protein ACFL2O_03290 [Thermodesulfobacteriota bacterium]
MRTIYCVKCFCPTNHELVFDPWEIDEDDDVPMVIIKEISEKIPGFNMARTAINKAFETPEKLYMCMQCGDHRWDY